MRVELLTLNLWNLSPPLEARTAALESWLARSHPDVLALQEVGTVGGRTQAHRLAAAAHYRNVHFVAATRRRGWEQGLAVVSDLPMTALEPTPLPDAPGDETRILQQVEVRIRADRLRLANTHLAWEPGQTEERTRQAAAITDALAGCPDPLVLVGDLNDVHGSPPLRELTGRTALTDRCCDDDPTFAADNPWTWQPLLLDRRVDHVLAHESVRTPRVDVVLTGEDAPRVSDHYGIRAQLEL